MSAYDDVQRERMKQINKWGAEHDLTHRPGELSNAGAFMAVTAGHARRMEASDETLPRWAVDLRGKYANDRRKQLVIAAALIMAEIDVIDSWAKPVPGPKLPPRTARPEIRKDYQNAPPEVLAALAIGCPCRAVGCLVPDLAFVVPDEAKCVNDGHDWYRAAGGQFWSVHIVRVNKAKR